MDWLFLIFGLAGIILILAGYFGKIPGVVILGGIILFALSMITYSEGIDFKTGEVTVEAPADTFTTTYTYASTTPASDITLNALTMVLTAIGFASILGSAWVVYKS